jgi:pilus assembly protein Flp/PilA
MNTFLANLYLRAVAVRDREEGQAMAEYGVILALIAVVVIVVLLTLGPVIKAAFQTVQNAID